ncbi:MAG: cysteine dioxygenase [Bacteroidia bacterium]
MIIEQDRSELDQIINLISNSDFSNVIELTNNIDVPLEQLEPYMFWDDKAYTRNCVARGENFELLVLCWDKGQGTAIHCHDDQECWVKVVEGSFSETMYSFDEDTSVLKRLSTAHLEKNETTSVEDQNLYHTLNNTSEGRGATLHLYMNPINKCTVYNKTKNCFEEKNLRYHSIEGNLCL